MAEKKGGLRDCAQADGSYKRSVSQLEVANSHSPLGHDDAVALFPRPRSAEDPHFRRIYEDHRVPVARLVYRLAGPRNDVEDLVQSVFVQIHRNLPSFRGDSALSTWIHRVTVNVVLMHLRAERRRPQLGSATADERDLAGSDRQPDEEVERRERMRAFERLLAKLTDKKRLVFVLHELEGLSAEEISKLVGAPVMTVRTRLFYARKELDEMLREEPALADGG